MSGFDDVVRNALAFERRRLGQERQVLEATGREGIAYAKRNHPWTNQTGQAEGGLALVVDHPTSLYAGGRVHLINRAPHGKWLEIARGGQWQILQTTAAVFGQELIRRLRA